MRIILKDEEPVCQPPRRLAFTERQEVNKQIEEWLNEGIIRPSSAEYASPIYIKDYSKIAKPLSDLTRKENLFWFFRFNKKKHLKIEENPVRRPNLAPLQVWRKTELHTDACKQGYRAILLQEAEDGKSYIPFTTCRKRQIQQKKRQHFKIVTDCSAFQKTMQKKKELITRIARWVLQLEEFDYEIEHRAGSRMKHVDALSRYPVMMVCNDTLTSKLKNAQEEDDNIQTLNHLEKQESEEFFLSEMVYSIVFKWSRINCNT
ncbi:transposon Ty3-I Gag-Pol polyprotein [Trichonephila clavipes]|nr:transposon Ty3-I Gag-Pol polyprotein [Trichonephila clavipes]